MYGFQCPTLDTKDRQLSQAVGPSLSAQYGKQLLPRRPIVNADVVDQAGEETVRPGPTAPDGKYGSQANLEHVP